MKNYIIGAGAENVMIILCPNTCNADAEHDD